MFEDGKGMTATLLCESFRTMIKTKMPWMYLLQMIQELTSTLLLADGLLECGRRNTSERLVVFTDKI